MGEEMRASPRAGGEPADASSAARALDSHDQPDLIDVEQRLHQAVGHMVLALMRHARYRSCTLASLQGLLLAPLAADRILMAVQSAGRCAKTLGFGIWASVSAEVDARIRAQIDRKIFPVQLDETDWASGDLLWLLDVIVPDTAQGSAVLASFHAVAGNRPVNIHPVAAGSVDAELLARLRVPVPTDAGMVR